MTQPYYDIPLNLPHAGTIARRILDYLDRRHAGRDDLDMLQAVVGRLAQLLEPYRSDGENPPPDEAERVCKDAARLARGTVDLIEKLGIGEDRLGQHIRNLFECLELGEEGARLSLRAGEDPKSAQRPH